MLLNKHFTDKVTVRRAVSKSGIEGVTTYSEEFEIDAYVKPIEASNRSGGGDDRGTTTMIYTKENLQLGDRVFFEDDYASGLNGLDGLQIRTKRKHESLFGCEAFNVYEV